MKSIKWNDLSVPVEPYRQCLLLVGSVCIVGEYTAQGAWVGYGGGVLSVLDPSHILGWVYVSDLHT